RTQSFPQISGPMKNLSIRALAALVVVGACAHQQPAPATPTPQQQATRPQTTTQPETPPDAPPQNAGRGAGRFGGGGGNQGDQQQGEAQPRPYARVVT